jgi:hypothetical protein
MNWNNLSKGICINECNEPLEVKGRMIYCKYCDFKIRQNKYQDLIKGKESKSYKQATKRFDKIKMYKEKMKQSVQANIDERNSLLKRMLIKGKITQEEYAEKYSANA